MKKRTVYIYPDVRKSTNDYIINFHKSFLENGYKVNNRLPRLRLLNLFFNLDSNVFIIHWVDVLPYQKYGVCQVLFLKICISFLSLMDKDIVWVMHNKTSHDKGGTQHKKKVVDNLMEFMAKYSTKVLVHAKDGLTYYNDKYGIKYPKKVIYIPHPVYRDNLITENKLDNEIKWDYIIWGNVNQYKMVLEFVKFTRTSKFFDSKKIIICGKCADKEYEAQIIQYLGTNITFINKFLSEDELDYYIKKAGNFLFTYSETSVLSSGALIYSLNYNKPIIGPLVGNFKEFEGIVYCYDTYEDITKLSNMEKTNNNLLENYIYNNTWRKFSNRLMAYLTK